MDKDRYEEIGRIKEVDSSIILQSFKYIKKGKVFDLGVEINEQLGKKNEGPFPFSMLYYKTPEDTEKLYKAVEKDAKASVSSEVIISPIHMSTHIDSLSHVQYNRKIIGKYKVEETRTNKGWKKCGSETIPPIVGRGVLLDMAKFLGLKKIEGRYLISKQEIETYIENKGIQIEFGDIVCIRTGIIQDYDKKDFNKAGPGISSEATEWLYKKGMCVICIDYMSLDPLPFRDFNNLAHVNMIYKNKVYIIESINLEELSKENIDYFFMVCSSPKITGCSGSFIRPVAII